MVDEQKQTGEKPADSDKEAHHAGNSQTPKRRNFKPKSRTGLILIATLAVLAIGAAVFIRYSSRFESTDDAQISGHIDPVSARINGHIKRIYVNNGQLVKAGTLRVDIDPTDYQKAYDQAKAAYDQALAESRGAQLDVGVVSANATNRIAEDLAGVSAAHSTVLVSREAYAQARAQQNKAQAQYKSCPWFALFSSFF